MEFSEELIKDSIRFSNFAQWVKMEYWKNHPIGYAVPEIYLDDILLVAWEYHNKFKLMNPNLPLDKQDIDDLQINDNEDEESSDNKS